MLYNIDELTENLTFLEFFFERRVNLAKKIETIETATLSLKWKLNEKHLYYIIKTKCIGLKWSFAKKELKTQNQETIFVFKTCMFIFKIVCVNLFICALFKLHSIYIMYKKERGSLSSPGRCVEIFFTFMNSVFYITSVFILYK